ncbi:hypothetical protein [Aeromicrobium duanguangcaii]|uniref:hypothetical protein n=1 Tax=Aeromicrobium duanguangcaii TaxID=2968086 RepID=UPI002016B3B2|nr:hypothetical protein [Aeromicrobium duanguangcaii]MCL3836688.1 hypothetical protein [Aeromicrobium duanguangcaii]
MPPRIGDYGEDPLPRHAAGDRHGELEGHRQVVKRGRAGGSKVTISRGKQAVNLRFTVGKKRGKAAVVLTASGSPRVAQKFTVTKKR